MKISASRTLELSPCGIPLLTLKRGATSCSRRRQYPVDRKTGSANRYTLRSSSPISFAAVIIAGFSDIMSFEKSIDRHHSFLCRIDSTFCFQLPSDSHDSEKGDSMDIQENNDKDRYMQNDLTCNHSSFSLPGHERWWLNFPDSPRMSAHYAHSN